MKNGTNVKKVEGPCKSAGSTVGRDQGSDELQLGMGNGNTQNSPGNTPQGQTLAGNARRTVTFDPRTLPLATFQVWAN